MIRIVFISLVLIGTVMSFKTSEKSSINKNSQLNIEILQEDEVIPIIGRICYGLCLEKPGSVCMRCSSPNSDCPNLNFGWESAGMHSDCSVQPD